MLSSLNLGKTIPVGNSDAGSYFNTKVLEASDYGVSSWHVVVLCMLIVMHIDRTIADGQRTPLVCERHGTNSRRMDCSVL